MLKKTITYVDYDGNSRTEDFYFNISRAEYIKMEMDNYGLEQMMQRIAQELDSRKLYALFSEIILMAYGEKSPDGKRFVKTQEMKDAFVQSEAYSELIMDMFKDDNAAAFFKGIAPKNPEDHKKPETPQ